MPFKKITRDEARERFRSGYPTSITLADDRPGMWGSAAGISWIRDFDAYEDEQRRLAKGKPLTYWMRTGPITNDDVAGYIFRRESVQGRNLTVDGARLGSLGRLGDLPPQERVKLGQAAREHGTRLMIVWSYKTPIAWAWPAVGDEPRGAYIPPVRYSLTTTQHQHLVAAALGVEWASWGEGSYSAHEPGTTQGPRGGGYTPYGPREGGY